MKISMILAVSSNGIIGYNGSLPWKIPEDLAHFKKITGRCPLIMGRKTFESLPKILPGRKHIVLTNDKNYVVDNPMVSVYNDIDSILNDYKKQKEVFVIGGAQMYKMFEGVANTIYVTEVLINSHGDTFLEPLTNRWIEVNRETPDVKGDIKINYVTFKRSSLVELEIK